MKQFKNHFERINGLFRLFLERLMGIDRKVFWVECWKLGIQIVWSRESAELTEVFYESICDIMLLQLLKFNGHYQTSIPKIRPPIPWTYLPSSKLLNKKLTPNYFNELMPHDQSKNPAKSFSVLLPLKFSAQCTCCII